MKIISVVGARPQFVKLASLAGVLHKQFDHIIVHTGQHYDNQLSSAFFDHLQIPKPDYNLNIGSDTHGRQTGTMLIGLENLFWKLKPRLVNVFGDTNSTIAGALAATKLHIPVSHVEAGMRSFNLLMSEEINRIVTDHISDLKFCSTTQSADWLKREGITKGVFVVGDLMIDMLYKYSALSDRRSLIMKKMNLQPNKFIVATIHRAENTDSKIQLENIFSALQKSDIPIILPLHPRTKKMAKRFRLLTLLKKSKVKITDPVGYFDMLQLEKNASLIITDSGGIQKEAYFFKKCCLTLRKETEWIETVQDKWNILVGTDPKKIINTMKSCKRPTQYHHHYGTGNAARKIRNIILRWSKQNNIP